MLVPTLKFVSPVFLMVGLLHLVLGLQAEVLLGARIAQEVLSDPVLDSQNRFYGVAFTLYGFLLYLCASDLQKYQTVLRTLIWVFFAAGCGRFVSIILYGLPSAAVLVLLATELILPPMCFYWLKKTLQGSPIDAFRKDP